MTILPEFTSEQEQDRPGGTGGSGGDPRPLGSMVGVTRLVPLAVLTSSGRISLARLRDLVSEIKAGHQELGESTLGDLELRRRGNDVELKMYFLPGTGHADGPEQGRE